MIKQIQLRGISRSPSDRMTEDGGLDESLNLYLDNAESAPALVPDDVTSTLGLPDDLQADKVFVHKTANYENYVVVDGLRIIAFGQGKKYDIITLEDNEEVEDMTTVGNTLVIATTARVLYMLFVNAEYKMLGNGVPVPHIEFQTVSNYVPKGLVNRQTLLDTDDVSDTQHNPINLFDVDVWNNAIEDIKKGISNAHAARLLAIQEELWNNIKAKISQYRDEDRFSAPFFVRYAVRLYDGSYVNHSVPILIGSGFEEFISVSGHKISSKFSINTYIGYQFKNIFDVTAYLKKWETEGWEDVIESVDIFASTSVYFPWVNAKFEKIELSSSTEDSVSTYTYDIFFDSEGKEKAKAIEEELVSKGVFYKIGSFRPNEETLQSGWKLTDAENTRSETELVLTEDRLNGPLVNDDIIPVSILNYNNKLLATSANVMSARGYSFLNSTSVAIGNSNEDAQLPLRIRFHIKGMKGTTVVGKYYDESYDYDTYEVDISEEGGQIIRKASMYGFLAHPDPNCYKVEIWERSGDVYSIPMKAHPRLNCSYAYWGLANTIIGNYAGADVNGEEFLANEDRKKAVDWKLYVYKSDNPFIIDQALSFQSRVLGVAIATTALSQGQFGQFPLYVFTEDGVWAIETAADGSFVTSKPLSRAVCTNPDSITSIDNAVVFVTDKGVMLLQGSQVVNISPYMNGRHYTINDSAQEMLALSDYASLLPSLTDEDTFMGFVKKASVAYDYAGKRLVFIKEDEEYQYVYKLDTQTWHKLKHEQKLMAPINSYPECLVQGEDGRHTIGLYIDDAGSYDSQTFEDLIRLAQQCRLPLSEDQIYSMFYNGRTVIIDLTKVPLSNVECFIDEALHYNVSVTYDEEENSLRTRIYDLSTVLDGTREQSTELGCIVTRPLDLGYADIKKVIKDLRIRGEYAKGHVQYILQGSDDGVNYFNTKLKQKSWKLFRIIIVCALDRHERISWIDVDFDIRYNNKLR